MKLLLTFFDDQGQLIGQRIHHLLAVEYLAGALPFLYVLPAELETAFQKEGYGKESHVNQRNATLDLRMWVDPVTGEYRDCRSEVRAILP